MANLKNNCGWEYISEFQSPREYKKFCDYLEAQTQEGWVRKTKVDPTYSSGMLSGGDWYLCIRTNEIWRLLEPEFPFKGKWEPIRRDNVGPMNQNIVEFSSYEIYSEANWTAYVIGQYRRYLADFGESPEALEFDPSVPADIRIALIGYFVTQESVDRYIYSQKINELGGLMPIDIMHSPAGLRALKTAIMKLY